MSDKCSKSRDNISTIIDVDRQESLVYKGILDRMFGKNTLERSKELSDQLIKDGYPMHTFVQEKYVSVAAVKAFGKLSEIKKYAALIGSLLDANPGIANLVHKILLNKMPKNIRMGKAKKGFAIPEGGIQINMERYPVSTLKYIYNKTADLLNQTNAVGFARAKVGSHFTKFKSPGKVAWLDPTGAVEKVASSVRDYSSNISSRINYFMIEPRFIPVETKKALKKKKLRIPKISMEKIIGNVKSLASLGDSSLNNEKGQQNFVRLFSQAMKGWVFIKNGQFYINKNYNPRRDEDGKIMRYESTGKVMWSFQDPVLLKNYTPLNKQKGEFNIDMTPIQLKRFEKALDDARIMTDAVFEYIVPEMKESTDQLMQGLRDHYDGKLTDFAIQQIFFYGNTEYKDRRGNKIDLLKPLNKDEVEEVKTVLDTFSMTIKDDLIIANQGALNPDEPEYRKNYWPTSYRIDNLRFMIGKLAKELRDAIKKTEDRIKDGFDSDAEAKMADKFLKNMNSKLESAESILNNMDNYNIDSHHDFLMNFASDNKHFKRISNAYDIRSSRLDEGVFYDYLKNMVGTVQRNKLAFNLLESLAILKRDRNSKKPKHGKEEAKAIIDFNVNLHSTTYNSLKTLGILGNMETFTRKMNVARNAYPPNLIKKGWGKLMGKEYNVSVTPAMQSRYIRNFTTTLSGLFLQNWKSAITNMGGAYKNLVRAGIDRTIEGLKLYTLNKEYEKGIARIIQQSGITEFSDFFSKAMVNDIVGNQLEAQVGEAIMKEMIAYHERIEGSIYKNKMSVGKSKKIFLENVEKFIGRSTLWVKAQELDITSKDRAKESLKEIMSRNKTYAANKIVQYAINKEYLMKPMLRQPLVVQWANTGFGKSVGLMANIIKATGLTMGNTEKHIRSLSFIIGAENAWKNGSIRNDIHWSEYTSENDVASVIAIGREYSYYINYGMSTQDVASYQYGPAQPVGKFKYWSQQNAEAEAEDILAALLSMQPGRDVQKASVFGQIKPIIKLLKASLAPGLKNKTNRLSKPEVAAVRTFFITQGIGTVMWNLMFFNPLSVKHFRTLRNIAWRTGSAQQLRNVGTSDLLHFLTLPIVFGLKGLWQGLFGGSDDEEDIDKALEYHMRRVPFAGYAVTWSYSAIMAVIAGFANEDELFVKKAEQLISVKYGRPQLGFFNFVSDAVRAGSTAVIETLYDIGWDERRD